MILCGQKLSGRGFSLFFLLRDGRYPVGVAGVKWAGLEGYTHNTLALSYMGKGNRLGQQIVGLCFRRGWGELGSPFLIVVTTQYDRAGCGSYGIEAHLHLFDSVGSVITENTGCVRVCMRERE